MAQKTLTVVDAIHKTLHTYILRYIDRKRSNIHYVIRNDISLMCSALDMGCFVPFVQINKSYENIKMDEVNKYELKDVCLDRCFSR